MKRYLEIFKSVLDDIKNEGRYRTFTQISYVNRAFPRAFLPSLNKEVTVWCSNDYLGMSQHNTTVNAAVEAARSIGVGSGGTRNISGNNGPIVELESEIADLHSKEMALIFTSGYIANQAALSTIAKIIPNIIMFSDEANHASIIHGIKDGRCEKKIFKHNDMKSLEEMLCMVPIERPKIILFESIYSMLGNVAPIREIIQLAKRYNALTYIDEVHSVGLYGKHGGGVCEELGISHDIDIIQGTMSKAFGVIGGYISGKRQIIDAIRSYASGFIFTTSLPPVVTSAALASIRYLKNSNKERIKHQEVVNKLKQKLTAKKINFHQNSSHIIPINISGADLSKQISTRLIEEFGIYAQHINYPTVPKGKERLRITPTPFHDDEMIDHLVNSLEKVLRDNEMIVV